VWGLIETISYDQQIKSINVISLYYCKSFDQQKQPQPETTEVINNNNSSSQDLIFTPKSNAISLGIYNNIGGIVVENRGYVLRGEHVSSVCYQHAGFAC
jgi:hypothetical protein